MILCPLYYDELTYPLNVFLMDAGALTLLLFPAAVSVVLWKVFVTNRTTPRGNILSLGLDESSASYSELYGRKIPWGSLFLHALVGVVTFKLGVLAFEVYWYLMSLIPDWLSRVINGA